MEHDRLQRYAELETGLNFLGLSLSAEQHDQLLNYLTLLHDWNEKINLTSVDREKYIPLHILDSLAVWKLVAEAAGTRIIDVGCGAGFPGLPLKIALPQLSLVLLDSTRKKTDFLQAVVESLGLSDVTCLHARAEEAGRDTVWRESFDVVTARALAPLNELVELTLPFVKMGGRLLALKSAEVDSEIERAGDMVAALGGEVVNIIDLDIPGTDIHRKVVVVQKQEITPGRFPRAPKKIGQKP